MNLMEQCSCGSQRFVETPCMTRVCTECGKETRMIRFVVSYSRNGCELLPFYHRRNRFKNLLSAVLFPCCGTSMHFERVLIYLQKRSPFKNNFELITTLKKCQARNKFYHENHFYNIMYVQNYKQPKPICANKRLAIREKMCKYFEQIEFGHAKFFQDTNFFSYMFLLRHCFEKYKLHSFIRFLKQIRSKLRIEKYKKKLKKIVDYFNAARFQSN